MKEEKGTAVALAKSRVAFLQSALNKSVSVNYSMLAMIYSSSGEPDQADVFAASLANYYPLVKEISLSPQGNRDFVYPSNRQSEEDSATQFNSPREREAYLRGEVRLGTQLDGPKLDADGEKVLVARLPIYLTSGNGQSVFWGFANTTLHFDKLMGMLNLNEFLLHNLQYQLVSIGHLKQNEAHIVADSSGALNRNSIYQDVALFDQSWRLYLAPEGSWVPWWKVLLGWGCVAFLSLLTSYFAYLALNIRLGRSILEQQVTERTAALHRSNKRMQILLDAVPESLYEVNEAGVIVAYSSRRLDDEFSQLGSPLNKHFTQFFPSQIASTYQSAIDQLVSTPSEDKIHQCYLDNEQGRHWFEFSVTYSPEGEHYDGFYILVSREVTQRKKTEEELRIAATAFQTQDGMMIVNAQNRIIRVNKAFELITGYSEAEAIGETPELISSGRHSRAFFRDMYDSIAQYGSWEGEIWNRRKNGELFPEWLSISIVKDDEGTLTHYVATLRDITENKDNESRIDQLNNYDTLTHLANRSLITKDLDHFLEGNYLAYRRTALICVDLDHFKDVNDLRGHLIGDMLLQQVASRLMDVTRSGDVVARFSGDVFLIMLEKVDASISADRIAYRAKRVSEKIMRAFATPFDLDGASYRLSASVGIALVSTEDESSVEVIKYAELAMYEAKGLGRNQVCFYAPQMQEKVLERVTLDSDFRRALKEEQFILHYQPQWNTNKQMVGVEALVRWLHPEKGMISPASFIPFAEESKWILPLGSWVLRSALEQLAVWQADPELQHLVVSVNVSALQFSQEGFVALVESTIKEVGVPASKLQIELTESMLVHDQFDIIQKMQSLKKLGILISLDDFGTGYSSLSYLQQLPIDQLKIDQSFVRAIKESDKQASLAASIIGLGHNLHMEVIAEGIETQEQFDWLAEHGCDLYQGFLLARPMSIDTFVYENSK